MVLKMTVERYIASVCFLLLVITTTFARKHGYDDDDDYSEEDSDYEKDFESYSSAESYEEGLKQPPLNFNGTLRKFFAVDAALSNPAKNLICSPVSALLPLGKLAIGANGQCLNQLLSAIGIESLSKIKKEFKPLIKRLGKLSGVTLTVVSKIFASEDIKLKPKYKKRAQKIFNSAVESVDFKNPINSAREINLWVKDKTHDKIPRIIMEYEISPQTSLVLVNAVYFSGTWLHTFKKVKVEKFFTPSSNRFRLIPMMTREGMYKYTRSDNLDAQLVEIPYQSALVSFVIILPNSKEGLPVLLHKLKVAPDLLLSEMRSLRTTDLILSIPKFKTATEIDLKDAYEKLGIREIFKTEKSGLDDMIKGSRNNIFVSKAKQKAVIEVTEKGTEAAAASMTNMVTAAGPLHRTIVNANHPFLYFIKFKTEQIFAGVFYY